MENMNNQYTQGGEWQEYKEPADHTGLIPTQDQRESQSSVMPVSGGAGSTSANSGVALGLGIASILFSSITIIGIGCGVASIIMANNEKKKGGDSLANAGFICGIVGTSLCTVTKIFKILRLALNLLQFLPMISSFL